MEFTVTIIVIWSVAFISIVVNWILSRYKKHELLRKYGIPGPRPHFFWGNLSELKKHPTPHGVIADWLEKYGNVFGYYIGEVPFIVVNDLEMLKQIMIKDFQYFENRPKMVGELNPIDKSVMAQESRRWKEIRSILTPSFSSRKIKLMTNIVNKKVDITVQEVSKHVSKNEMFDIHKLVQGLTLDVIAACIFAMKSHCQENKKDQILVAVREFLCNTTSRAIGCAIMFPFTAKLMYFAVSCISSSGQRILLKNLNIILQRRIHNPDVKSLDVMQLMVDKRCGKENGITDEEIIANTYLFLLAGYESTATALASTFHLLITHPDVQTRLQNEIDCIEEFDHANIQSLQYLDQVFNEVLRIYPPSPGIVVRRCAKDYSIGKYTIPKGAQVVAPVWDIHHDPNYWPDPWKFDPDRFSPENKKSLNTTAFLAFGIGPRNCFGARFAQLEAKLAICRLLKIFTFEKCVKTDDPMQLICPTANVSAANGVWLKAVKRR